MMYTILHAVAVASLWMIVGVVVLLVGAEVWGWLNKRDPAEFWMQRERDTQEAAEFAPYRNRDTESALPTIRGDYDSLESRPFMLDVDPRGDAA